MATTKATTKAAPIRRLRNPNATVYRTQVPSTLSGTRAEVYKRIKDGMTVSDLQTKMVHHYNDFAWNEHTWQVLDQAVAQGFVTICNKYL
jgi:hypothetical protein